MDICLVTAPIATEFERPEEFQSDAVFEAGNDPPLGVLSLAAVLEAQGTRPAIANLNRLFLDYARSGCDPEGFAREAASSLADRNAGIYGFSSICSGYPLTIRIARELKRQQPEALVLLGGPQASVVDTRTLAAFPFVDFILRGEAEHTLPLLLQELADARQLNNVPGLTFRGPFGVQRNSNAPLISDLDALPTPAYHLTGELRGASRATLELGRGCPFACTFCSTNDFFRRNFRLRSPQRILADMRSIAAEYSISSFELVHDMFTIDRRRVLDFCEAMIASGETFTWSCSARTDCVDTELLERMYRAGCRSVFFGVESGSERMQGIIGKNLDPARASAVVAECERIGILTTVSFIVGFPEETQEDLAATVRLFMDAARWPHADPQLNLLAPLAATPLHTKHLQELSLEDLCSEMSRQGSSQNRFDLDLIRGFPDIFPNFYSLPTPCLDRGTLAELREFFPAALARFRWLLCSIEQSAGDFLEWFLSWHRHRLQVHPHKSGAEVRDYYRTGVFARDFLLFVQTGETGKADLVRAFWDYETNLRNAPAPDAPTHLERVLPGATLRWTDVPLRSQGTKVLNPGWSIERATAAIQSRTKPDGLRENCFYATRRTASKGVQLYRISDWTAMLMRACDGTRTVEEVVALLSSEIAQVPVAHREYTFLALLQGSHENGCIEIFRSSSDALESHDGGGSSREYTSSSAFASVQNQASIQRL